MSFFLLPSIPLQDNIDKLFNVSYTNSNDNTTNSLINKTLYSYLKSLKERIDSKIVLWDKYKKFINPYEYIHSTVPNTSHSVCKLNPLSRSFFKMIELINTLNLFDGFPMYCRTFHLAEGPGGFVEATSYIRQCKYDTYYAMTLIDDENQTVPGWKKSKHFLNNNSNVIIEKGRDGTGNIMNPDNLKYCYNMYNNSIDFITADGGFDFSSDFNNQELISGKLMFSQIAFAFAMQKRGGHFVIKFFDIFTKSSIDMIYFLSMVYNQVYIVKPNTSRYTNSEKYIVCKDFRMDSCDYKNRMIIKMYEIMKTFDTNQHLYFESLFSIDIPYYYINKMEEYNAIIGQQQIEYIFATLNMINNHKYNHYNEIKNIHIQKCIGWCKKFKLPYNKMNNYGIVSNLFNSQMGVGYNNNNNINNVGATTASVGVGVSVSVSDNNNNNNTNDTNTTNINNDINYCENNENIIADEIADETADNAIYEDEQIILDSPKYIDSDFIPEDIETATYSDSDSDNKESNVVIERQ